MKNLGFQKILYDHFFIHLYRDFLNSLHTANIRILVLNFMVGSSSVLVCIVFIFAFYHTARDIIFVSYLSKHIVCSHMPEYIVKKIKIPYSLDITFGMAKLKYQGKKTISWQKYKCKKVLLLCPRVPYKSLGAKKAYLIFSVEMKFSYLEVLSSHLGWRK